MIHHNLERNSVFLLRNSEFQKYSQVCFTDLRCKFLRKLSDMVDPHEFHMLAGGLNDHEKLIVSCTLGVFSEKWGWLDSGNWLEEKVWNDLKIELGVRRRGTRDDTCLSNEDFLLFTSANGCCWVSENVIRSDRPTSLFNPDKHLWIPEG